MQGFMVPVVGKSLRPQDGCWLTKKKKKKKNTILDSLLSDDSPLIVLIECWFYSMCSQDSIFGLQHNTYCLEISPPTLAEIKRKSSSVFVVLRWK